MALNFKCNSQKGHAYLDGWGCMRLIVETGLGARLTHYVSSLPKRIDRRSASVQSHLLGVQASSFLFSPSHARWLKLFATRQVARFENNHINEIGPLFDSCFPTDQAIFSNS